MNTNENNILIAEFMQKGSKGFGIYDFDGCFYNLSELKFNCSWDWLMPVVQKIESQQSEGYNILIEGTNCWIETQGVSFECMGITKLEATYKAVVQFIKEYNQNN